MRTKGLDEFCLHKSYNKILFCYNELPIRSPILAIIFLISWFPEKPSGLRELNPIKKPALFFQKLAKLMFPEDLFDALYC